MILYDPRADIVFRKIFGTHKNMCISLLNALLPLADEDKIVAIEYQDPDLLPETPDKKNSVVDVRCTDAKGRTFLVEMQMFWTDAFLMRSLLNASKAFVAQTQRGMVYKALQPVYSLCLLNENMPDTREYRDEYTHTYYIQHEHHRELRIGGMIFVFVELTKFKSSNRVHNRLAELWLTFLTFVESNRDTVVPEMLRTDPVVNSALECLEHMYLTDGERLAYDKYWDSVSYERTLISGKFDEGKAEGIAEGIVKGKAEGIVEGIAKGKAEGIAEGIAKGKAEGIAEGIAKGKAEGMEEGMTKGHAKAILDIAVKMKRRGLPSDQIAAITGLSAEDIARL